QLTLWLSMRRVRWDIAALPLGIITVLALWQLVILLGDYPQFVLPAPLAVAGKFVWAVESGNLWRHLRVTLVETLAGFSLGFLSATLVGYWLAKKPVAERLVAPWLVAMQAVPVVAVAPLLVIWFGFGILSKILVCALIVFFPVLINTIVGVRSVDREWHELMTVLRASRWQRFRLVELPAALPVLFGGIKLGVTLAVVGAVVGEFVGAREGLGALINIARAGLYDTALLFVALLTLAAMALTLYGIVSLIERRVVRWQR
ncbi:MAG: ABC transporter permease, partial [Ardenticatenaceae bacterium]